jgi:phosphinothricin acetyltransferase
LTELKFVDCTLERHGQAILEILNEAIANSTALYDYKPRTWQDMISWFEIKRAGDFPVIGIEGAQGQLLGFASYGTFRAWPAFKYSVEHSVYVHHSHRGQGLGAALLKAIIDAAIKQQKHALIGGIDAANGASIELHKKFDFKLVGTLPQVGFKFGRWLDLAFYQLTLETPEKPSDG